MPRSAAGSGTLARMRSLRRALLWASAAGMWFSCSVNQAGLPGDGGVHADVGAGTAGSGATAGRGGTGGSLGTTGTAGAAGTVVTGTAGAPTGTAGGGATAGATAGAGGTSGSAGAAGESGAAGTSGAGGDPAGAAGNGGEGGAGGTGNAGGSSGSAGAAGVAGTIGGAGGVGGATGGRGGFGAFGGFGARGGAGGQAGRGGASGRGGTGGNPCATYPSGAKAFVTPTDGRTHCYWPRSSSQTWSEAQQSCTLQNGHLVTILSAEENAFVVSVAQFSTNFSDTWIGATDGKAGSDKNGPGTYKWVTNETWSYSNWQQGQPDGYCDPCSGPMTCTCDHRAVLASDGTWNDRWQDNQRPSVCEATAN